MSKKGKNKEAKKHVVKWKSKQWKFHSETFNTYEAASAFAKIKTYDCAWVSLNGKVIKGRK